MIGLRDIHLRRFGASLAGLALYVQLVLAVWGGLPPVASAAQAGGFDAHALCLAGIGGDQQPPSDHAPPAPAHNHAALCCLWHALPGVPVQAAAAATLPVAYANVALDRFGGASVIPGPHRGPANARAPPTLA